MMMEMMMIVKNEYYLRLEIYKLLKQTENSRTEERTTTQIAREGEKSCGQFIQQDKSVVIIE